MPKTSVPQWDVLSASNTDVGGTDITGTTGKVKDGDNAMREIMAEIASYTRRGSDTATATTLNLDNTPNEFLDITGTTTVTAVTLTDKHNRRARAVGAFQLTASASLIVNGSTSTNYTTTAGDLLFFEGYGSNVVRVWAVPGGAAAVEATWQSTNTPINLSLSATVSSNALTIAIKGHDGNDPSSSNKVYVPFRSVTANSGDTEVLTLSAATSVVVSSGSTLGTSNGVAATLVVVGFNDGGTFRLGVINPTALPVKDGIASSTAEGGAGAADTANTIYTGTAVTSKGMRVLGVITITEATAGTWASAPTTVQVGNDASTALQTGPGLVITPWVAYTPTFTGFGTESGVSAWSRRVGDTLQLRVKYTSGTSTAVEARMTLGFNGTNANVTSDATKVPTIQLAGVSALSIASDAYFTILIEGGVGYVTFGFQNGTNAGLTKQLGQAMIASGTTMSFSAEIPISGW